MRPSNLLAHKHARIQTVGELLGRKPVNPLALRCALLVLVHLLDETSQLVPIIVGRLAFGNTRLVRVRTYARGGAGGGGGREVE